MTWTTTAGMKLVSTEKMRKQYRHYDSRKKKYITRYVYYCGLCGCRRVVRTEPQSKCWCRVKFPDKYMYFKCQVRDFFIWLWQWIRLRFVEEWE